MSDDAGLDVLGEESRPRCARRDVCLVLLGVVVGAVAGAGAASLWLLERQDALSEVVHESTDEGAVYVCGGHAVAVVHATGLPDVYTEVHLPLRGDGRMLPVVAGDVRLLAGTATGHQTYVPDRGVLTLVQPMVEPTSATVRADVGDHAVELRVERCGAASS
jgi:hypothetical protein